ncbi:MAG: flagellar export chaperone FliS [Bryobacteraceae bacterium]|nr:flagellar export chaperone FliS [Bryobacteraceae bacterium]
MSYSDHYLESRVFSASPVELVRMIYRGALDANARARQHFANGDIAARTRCLNQSAALVAELVTSLECPPGPAGQQLEQNLRRLYDYVLHQIGQAAIDQNAAPLDLADQVLRELLSGWQAIEAAPLDQDYAPTAISVSA